MKMIIKLCVLFIFSHYKLAFCAEIDMITDVIGFTDKVTSVVAYVCWKPSKQVQLMSSIMGMTKPKTIRFVNSNWIEVEPLLRERVVVVTDMNCPGTKNFLTKASALRMLEFPYRWLVIYNPINESKLEKYDFKMLVDSEVIVAQSNGSDSYILTMIYRLNVNSTWVTEYFGHWSPESGIKNSELAKSSISTRRKNFNREPVKTVMVVIDNKTKSDPYDLSDIFTDSVTKSTLRVVDPLYGYLNASSKFIFTDTWGYNKNGTYGGMVAELSVGDADLSATIIIITQDRMKVIDYLISPMPITIKFVFREPPLSYQNNLFLLPFKATVWYCMGALILVLIIILYINVLWENKKLNQSENTTDPTVTQPNLSDIVILVMSAILQQGCSTELKGTLGRISMFLLFFSFLLLYAAYSASIVALLQSSSKQIRTLSDLLHSKLELGVEDTSYNRYFFLMATEPVRKAIYDTKIAPPGKKANFMSLEEGVKKLQKEPFAFNMNIGIGYRLIEKYFHEHEKCDLQEISYLYDAITYITSRKESPYKEIFKIGLFRLKEHGLNNRVDRMIYGRKPVCQARGGNFGSVNMVDFHPVLLMYLYGIILAFLILFIEILANRHRNMQLVSDTI